MNKQLPLTLDQMIATWATSTPAATAILAPGRASLTYARLQAHVESAARHLNAYGIRAHDRVALVLPNGPEMVCAFLAITAAGATSAPLNPQYRAEELDFCLTDLRANALIAPSDGASEARAVAAARGIPVIELRLQEESEAGLFTLSSKFASTSISPECPRPEDVALVLHTSGTTSRPKLVPLTHANLVLSARNIQAAFRLAPSDRCLNVMPLFHIHGLVGAVLSSLAGGSSVVCPPAFYAPEFFGWFEEFQPTWYTAVPTMHQGILARAVLHCEVIRRQPLRFIRSSSAAMSRQVMRDLEETFCAPVIETYGMTETAHQIAGNPLPPARRKEGSVGLATGTEIRILDAAGNLLPPGVTGEVVVRGPTVTSGYENDSSASAAILTGGWFRTGDEGYLDGDGYLFLSGRIKEIINRGGEKISPREVDDVLTNHPAVAQAITFSVPNPILGEEVAAAVVLRAQATVAVRELREFAAGRLADYKVPRQIVIVDKIPQGPTGKLQRMNLAQKLELTALDQVQPPKTDDFEPPRTPVESLLAEIWSQVLRITEIGRRDNFLQLGGDSLLAAQIVGRVRTRLQVEISLLAFFETPTIESLAHCIEEAKNSGQVLQPLPARRSSGMKTFPLSYGQQALWFLDRLEPGNLENNRPAAFRLMGLLDVSAMEGSLNALMARHEALRTIYPMSEEPPVQVIVPAQAVSLPVLDLSTMPTAERDGRAHQLSVEEARRSFDLSKGPMMRATLLKLSESDHILLVVMHHIASDGWSSEIFFRELAICYNAFASGKTPNLPPLKLQYTDFALWQRQWLQGERLEELLRYWRGQIGARLPRINFAVGGAPQNITQPRAGAHAIVNLPRSLTETLKTLSKKNNVTLFMTLLTAFKILLYRYTGQEDLVVATPIAARNLVEFEPVIGDFINMLLVRTRLLGNLKFRSALERVREVTLQAYAHQDLPLARLAESLRADHGSNLQTALQVMFNFRNFPSQGVEFVGLQSFPFAFDSRIARFDLSLEIAETPQGLLCRFEYDKALFDNDAIGRLSSHFGNLLKEVVTDAELEGVVADPDRPISMLALMTESEKHQLCVEWNDTRRPDFLATRVHQLFEEQVARRPHAVAVVSESQRLTYDELNDHANRLANYLRRQGVGPESFVGLCVERSPTMIVGILGVLKAGGGYVPLDPAYPRERLVFMLRDSKASVLLTESSLLSQLPEMSSVIGLRSIICLDRDWEVIAHESANNPICSTAAENAAYVIYTSGSTGKSKGVIVTHRSLANAYRAWEEAYQLREVTTAHLQMANFSFDVFSGDWARALCSGGKLVLCPTDYLLDAPQLYALARREQVDCAEFVPAVIRNLLQYLDESGKRLEFMRTLVVASEVWSVEEYQQIQRLCGRNTRLINSYGLTETTIDSSYFAGDIEGLCPDRSVPIGKPFANTQLYILDRHMQPVPMRVPGELYIGGAGLARGYLNRPDLTAERFIPNPFSDEPGSRLYKTGDLARYLPDGNIEFLGRLDSQVKIRGFRIELGEIESTLGRHSAVRNAVVLAREDRPRENDSVQNQKSRIENIKSGKRLVAYVVNRGPVQLTELRDFLKSKLPDYMVPSSFIFLDALPLTPNGKVDHKALPTPDDSRPRLEEGFVAARTPVEEIIGEIWAEVLKVNQVGVLDNFFELGGHSLLVTQVMSRLRKVFQVELPLRGLFEAPTVAGLAERIEALRREAQGLPHIPIVSVPRPDELRLSFAQERLWFLDQLEPGSHVYNISTQFRVLGQLDSAAFERSINEIVRRHETLRTTFKSVDGVPRQVIASDLTLAVPTIDLSDRASSDDEKEVRRYAGELARRPFDLSRGPLIRAALLRLGEEEHHFLLSMHHIVSDGWSMATFLGELSVLYEAYSNHLKSPLPELPIQYADYAVWQRNWLKGEVLEAHRSYWNRQLQGLDATSSFPTDRPEAAVRRHRGKRAAFELSTVVTDGLKALSRRESTTLFMTLLAAFQTLLYRYTGRKDIVVGSPIANRNQTEIEGLIGFFVNTLIFRSDLSGNPTFRELLTRVREVCLGAYTHQDLPYQKLVAIIHPQRDPNRGSIAQAVFAFQNVPRSQLRIPGLTITPIRTDLEIAKAPLTLFMWEADKCLAGSFNYDADLFNASSIGQLSEHFQALLAAVIADPEQRLVDLPPILERARSELLEAIHWATEHSWHFESGATAEREQGEL